MITRVIFLIIPSSANFDVLDTFEGRLNSFLYVTEFLKSFTKISVFYIYMHNIPRMKIIIDERTVNSFFFLC